MILLKLGVYILDNFEYLFSKLCYSSNEHGYVGSAGARLQRREYLLQRLEVSSLCPQTRPKDQEVHPRLLQRHKEAMAETSGQRSHLTMAVVPSLPRSRVDLQVPDKVGDE